MELLEIREVSIRGVDEETRTVSGIAVPYNQTTTVNGMQERVEKGAFGTPENVTLFYGHDHRSNGLPIGKVTGFIETEDGLEIKARIAQTPKGDEVYTLLREGVLNKFSIGFQPIKSRREGNTIVRERGDLKEVSIVAIPAYSNAAVSEVRADNQTNNTKEKQQETMTEVITPDVAEIREAVSDLERKFAVLADTNTASTSTEVRHPGEFLKALASGDSSAQMEVRAFTGAVTADSIAKPSFVNERLRLAVENRDILNLFSKGALPASGNSIEYPKVSGVSGTVGVQANEGDDLPYMEVTLTTETAPVKTYGGYSSLSRQAIERSDVAYLETVLEFQARQYAKATNKAVRDAFVGGTGYNTASLNTTTAGGDTWLELILNSAQTIEDNSKGSFAEFVVMNTANYIKLAKIKDTTGRPVFDLNADGANTFGNLNLPARRGVVGGLPIVVDNSLANGNIWIASSDAVKVYEQSGAPFRLQDENIINLTKDFSLYGYMAVAIPNPLAVVKVAVTSS